VCVCAACETLYSRFGGLSAQQVVCGVCVFVFVSVCMGVIVCV